MPSLALPSPSEPSVWVPPEPAWKSLLREQAAWAVALAVTGLSRVFARPADRPAILMYHRITDPIAQVAPPTINVPPKRFAEQMEGLKRLGYQFWPLRRLIEEAMDRSYIPPGIVVVTFDDGFECVYLHAFPVLRRLRIPATVFLPTAFLDQEGPFPFDHWAIANREKIPPSSYRPMRWEQCRTENLNELIEWGAHTHTHQDFRGRPQQFEEDLRRCLNVLQTNLGVEQPTFAFPYGAPHLGFADESLMAVARRLGVRCALTTETGTVDVTTDPFGWPRLHVFAWDTARTIDARIRGWYSWLPRTVHSLRQAWFFQSRRREPNPPWAITQHAPCSAQPPLRRQKGDHAGPTDKHSSELSPIGADTPRQDGRGPADSRSSSESSPAWVDDTQSRFNVSKKPPGKRPLISVIVPTFNRASWLAEALKSLILQETYDLFDFEIVVVDNNSTDHTREVVHQFALSSAKPVRYVFQPRPGDAPARNAGIQAAAGEWLAFFDDDQLADAGWLRELYLAAVNHHALIVGGPVYLLLSSQQYRWCGPRLRRVLRESRPYDGDQPYKAEHLPGTGNALVARSVFDAIGTFDESMVDGGSDQDFFRRALRHGYTIWYAARAVIYHRVPEERLTREYLRWESISGGACQASQKDLPARGVAGVWALALLRCAKAVFFHLPAALFFAVRGQKGYSLGHWTVFWRAEGYLRQALALLFPRLCAQKNFFAWLAFRNGRTIAAEALAKRRRCDHQAAESSRPLCDPPTSTTTDTTTMDSSIGGSSKSTVSVISGDGDHATQANLTISTTTSFSDASTTNIQPVS